MKFSLCIQFFFLKPQPVVLCILDAYCTLVLRSTRVCIYCMCIVIRSTGSYAYYESYSSNTSY